MKATWEQIADYVRGIASPEVAAMVEADSQAREEVKSLQVVAQVAKDQAPENWINRAKALLAKQPVSRTITGVLRFGGASLQPGFRSGSSSNLATLEFEDATLEASSERLPQTSERQIVGILDLEQPEPVRVGTEHGWLTHCDEEGQFMVRIPDSEQKLRFQRMESGTTYEIELQDEN